MQPKNNQQPKMDRAFTLIELLLVVAIVGILAGLAVVNMSGATESARIAKIKVFASSIRNSLMGNRVSEWRFDETSGTAVADTAGTNTGTLANFNFDATSSGWRIGPSCVSDGCLQFDGVNDSVSFGAPAVLNPGLGNWTVGGWVFAEDYTYPKSRFPIGGYLSSGSNWYIDASYNSNGTVIGFSDGTNRVTGSLNCDAGYRPNDTKNKWTNIYVIFDRTAGRVYEYVNGVKQSNTVDISSVTGSVTNPYDYISGVAGWMLDGFVDDVRVYSTALTASRIKENYLAGLDQLLAKGQITQQDYRQRIADLNLNYAIDK